MIELPILSRSRPQGATTPYLLCPWMESTEPSFCDLVSLLPVINVNEAVLSAIGDDGADSMTTAALMLADPFLRLRDCFDILSRAGIRRVANFPTVQLIDGETARSFDSARTGVAREIEMLAAFHKEGFETTGFAANLHAAREVLRAGASTIVLHPGFALSDWRERASAALSVARITEAMRTQTRNPILVYRPHGFGRELDPALEAADGFAWMRWPGSAGS